MVISNCKSHIDIILNYEVFKGKVLGTYLECGANDGKTDSISYFFEKRFNWRGILIEPQHQLMMKCRENRAGDNIFIEKGLSDKEELIEMTIPEDNLDNGSFALSEDHIKQLKKDGFGKSFRTDIIEVITYNNVIEQHGIKNIDLAIIDVEGYENKVLKSIMKSKVLPQVIVAEYDWSDLKELNKIVKRKYNILKQFDNDIVYIRK